MILVRPKSSAHWYTSSGAPIHTIIGASGTERSTSLRDARKFNLLPSVTSVLGVLAKPGLEAWKQEQAILAALTLPRNHGESDDTFAGRVVLDMSSQVEKAAGFGTAIHAAIEQVNAAGNTDSVPPEVRPWMDFYNQWREGSILRVLRSEETVMQAGYAGRFDLLADHAEHGVCLVDFKTQNVKKSKPNFYAAWGYQLAAYRHALGMDCQCLSLVIDSNRPAAPVEKLWAGDELDNGLEIFKAALEIWQRQRGYIPGKEAASPPPLTP